MKKRRRYIPSRHKELDRRDILSFMASLSVCAGKNQAAEGYLLELLALLAFAERSEPLKHVES